MYSDFLWDEPIDFDNVDTTVIDIIATLHNLLYESIAGKPYDYMWHWCNKIGSDCNDHAFDDLLKGDKENENN